ncbi:MAG: signal peptide peptidase SppA [Alphaproteobacteria bacterium]|nr:signal peptide peptidase SppA [Alphaproteobacteria bacterium]
MDKRRWRRHRPLFATPAQSPGTQTNTRCGILHLLWGGLKRICTVLGAFFLLSMVMGVMALVGMTERAQPPLPEDMVLFLSFDDALPEISQAPGLTDPFPSASPTLQNMVEAIDMAAKDPRVKGLVATMEGGGFALSHIQEVRAAVKRFRENGKFTSIYSTSYGDTGGFGGYWLASAFAEIWLQPIGTVAVTGLNAEIPFFRDTLDKIGVKPEFFQREEYKTAYESLTNASMSAPNREMTERLLGDIRAEIVKDITTDRGLDEATFEKLVDKGFLTAPEALAGGLITKVDYTDVLEDQIKKAVTGDPESDAEIFVSANGYLAGNHKTDQKPSHYLPQSMQKTPPGIALIHAVGVIMPTGTDSTPAPSLMGGGIAAADEISAAIQDATDDDSIKAVVLRIDSPGGSPTASETILRALQKTKEKGKPVIVSMGPTAASGGYWIAVSADRIFAMPTTLTGSIGVLGGKFSGAALWDKLGVNWERLKWGENAGAFSINTPFSDSEAERINAMLDDIYSGFVARVAQGRKMDPASVEKIARGQVWSGRRAVEIGLVDEIGGLSEALNYTAKLLGAQDRTGADVVILPRPKTPMERLMDLLGRLAQFTGAGWQGKIPGWMEHLASYAALIDNPRLYQTYEPLRVE